MPIDGLEIMPNTGQKIEKNTDVFDDALIWADKSKDYKVTKGGQEFVHPVLEEIKTKGVQEKEKIIYGIYNNSQRGLWVKINDFFVDKFTKVTLKDKSYFFHMLAVMVDAGISVVQALKVLARRTANERFRRVINTVAYNAERGLTVSEAMSRFDNVFSESEIGIVRSGEATGKLGDMLFKLSTRLDKSYSLYMKLWGAAVYPITVLIVLILVTIGMLLWVFPTLLSLLEEGGMSSENLPGSTKFLIFLEDTVVNFWWLILFLGFGFYGFFLMYKGTDYGSVKWDYLKLRIPIVGDLLRKVFVLRFVSILGLLIEAGVPVIRALEITGNSISNRVYKLKTWEIIAYVGGGRKISESMEDSEYLFPLEVVQMLAVGENTASLGSISEKIANQFEKEIDNTLKKVSSIFEPLLILFVGLFVALLAMAIMAPIFNLSSTIA